MTLERLQMIVLTHVHDKRTRCSYRLRSEIDANTRQRSSTALSQNAPLENLHANRTRPNNRIRSGLSGPGPSVIPHRSRDSPASLDEAR
jgi:hypothetical protein